MMMAKANNENWGEPDQLSFEDYYALDAVRYLTESQDHALVIWDKGGKVAVFHGAGDDEANWYWAALPCDDPGDANGGDLLVSTAINQAISWLSERSE
jgi:hypothetical protein